jgi:hypothetical protein
MIKARTVKNRKSVVMVESPIENKLAPNFNFVGIK